VRTYNLSPNRETYYSQRNNELSPGVTCKPTATVECLDIAGWPLPTGGLKQPEDNLTAWCRGPAGAAIMAGLNAVSSTPGNEDWRCIREAINGHFDPDSAPVIGPRWDWGLREVLFGITRGRPFAASTYLTAGGHVVALVGFETAQEADFARPEEIDMAQVQTIIIDDPYGDRTVPGGYGAGKTDGWNCRYRLADWVPVWRSTGIQIKAKGEA